MNGTGVDVDYTEGIRLFCVSAEQGHAAAQFNLGQCSEHGAGVAQDSVEAVRWYRLAADQGNANALQSLARLGL
jgi:TPR repeat protein